MVGAAAAVAIIGGPLSLALAAVAIVLVGREPRRDAPMGGLSIGLGLGWIALLGIASLRCDDGCVGPDLRGWLAVASAAVVLGAVLSIRAWRAARSQ